MPVDDRGANASSTELIGEHQSGWTRSDDENIRNHVWHSF
jgi:hypothetical protein